MSKTKPKEPSDDLLETMATPPSELTVPAQRNTLAGMLANYSALPSTENAPLATTLDMSVRRNQLAVVAAVNGESLSLWDAKPGETFAVTDLVAHYAESVDEETGEIRRGPMLTLIGPSGAVHTGSEFAFRALQTIAKIVGPPPWSPPILLQAVRIRSRNKREFQSIVLAE